MGLRTLFRLKQTQSTSAPQVMSLIACTIVHPDFVVNSFFASPNWFKIEMTLRSTKLCFLAKHRSGQIELPCKNRRFYVLKLFLSQLLTLNNNEQLSKCLHQRGKVAYGMPLRKLDIIALKPLTSITFDLT